MNRLLRNLAAAASALLTAATAVLWVRSHVAFDRVTFTTSAARYVDVASAQSGIGLRVAKPYPYREPLEWGRSYSYIPVRGPWYALGFAFHRGWIRFVPMHTGPPDFPPAPYAELRVPYWFLLLVFAAYPFGRAWLALRRRRERLRRARGACLCCGYDLRASTGRCPECGTAFAPAAAGA